MSTDRPDVPQPRSDAVVPGTPVDPSKRLEPPARLDPTTGRISLVGYGEVGRILAEDLRAKGVAVAAFDLKLADPTFAGSLREHASRHGVGLHASHADLATASDLVISAVTARQTEAVAAACAAGLRTGCWFLDLNSASPRAKRAAAAAIEAVGGRYVEAAVMTSVPPHRLAVPMLLGGPHAEALRPALSALGFAATVASATLGVASATKLCRSVMIKGLEAMTIESLTAARFHGVEDAVIASLVETFPGIDWERQASYFFQRVIEHGRRRAEEMHEAAATVEEAGLHPWSAAGTAERQGEIAAHSAAGVFGAPAAPGHARSPDWRTEADRLLAAIGRRDAPVDERP